MASVSDVSFEDLVSWISLCVDWANGHQKFQVPTNGNTVSHKAILGAGFPLHKPYVQLIYIYIGEYLYFRYLKCLVKWMYHR